jgi:WD40 repeat protein
LGSWDVATDPAHPRLEWRAPTGLAVVPINGDGTIVANEEPGRRLVVRDGATRKELGRIGPIDNEYDLAAVSPDGRLLAVGSRSSPKISVWVVATGREKARFNEPNPALVSLAFGPDGRYLALERAHGVIEIRDLNGGAAPRVTPRVTKPHPLTTSAFSPDGRFVATSVSSLGNARPTTVWQLDPWREVATYPGVPGGWSLFTHESRSMVVNVNQAAIRWDYIPSREPDQPAGHDDEAWSVAFSPDGTILASGSDDTDERRTIKLWDVAGASLVRGWQAGAGTVAALAFEPRGQALASAHLNKPGEVRLWDPATGRHLASLSGHTDSVRTVAFSPDGQMLASGGSDRAIRLWDVASAQCIRVLDGHADSVRRVAFSPDGSRLASASNDFTVRLWEVARGAPPLTLRAIDKVAAVAFAPDGRSLAAADEKGMVSVWDADTGARLHSMASEHDLPLCLAYSGDGRSLAVAGKTRTIRLWDPVTGQELLTLNGHVAQINALAFAPDGRTLASCSHDGVVRLWRGDRPRLDTLR